jgi:peptide methionine sulfoxide reductase MsrA
MTTEKAILAGGCFWGVQDLIRKLADVITTRVGYTGGDVPNATYRNHPGPRGATGRGLSMPCNPQEQSASTDPI